MSQDFVHLHVHTEFSLLDGLSRIKKLVGRAKELNMPALAITDHGTMFGVIDFFKACSEAGIKPIIGVEAYLAARGMEDRDPRLDKRAYHMLLLARNETGYKNLLKISSEAQLRGYYYRPRIDREFLAAHAEGLIATSGCLAAEIPRMVVDGQEDTARELIGWYQDVFGPGHFFLELQHHNIPELEVLNKWLYEYRRSGHSSVQLLATNDVHYVRKEDADVHDTLLCIQTSSLKSDADRMRMSDPSYHLASQQEMWAYFKDVPEALLNTHRVAEMCDVDLESEGYHLPVFPVPPGYDEAGYLRYLVEKGLDWRFGSRRDDAVLRERIERELGIIHNMGFDTYFLIVWDLCEFARFADIWWNVRGSGAGSLVAYCLGITNIDPIQNSLLFERFLNPGRISMPDIDLDYPDDRRSEMIAYTAEKYGVDKVAAIITFGTMGAKAAVRDVGRALNVDLTLINRAASYIPTEARQKPLMEYVELSPELKQLYKENDQIRMVIDAASELQGVSRHASTHAAGVIVSDKPLVEYLPLHRITGTDPSGGALQSVTQFPMETCEAIGLLKVDFLGLSTLTILRQACDLIEQHHGKRYTMETIPYRHDDPHLSEEDLRRLDEAYVMMGRGETVGVFQVESGGMQQMLRGMRPKRFENIIAGISLYRPGPMDYIPTYNDRLHGRDRVDYIHPRLEPILAETYGIIVYQEQIMQIASELFGYELGDADTMRRAVSKKKQKDLIQHKDIFLQRGPLNGIDTEAAERIFADIEFFANYGFNKSHAADYAVITVQTAFLKAHYPHEYMTALLMVHRDDSAKIATFLEECRRLEIPILPPDVNYSMLNFSIEPLPDGQRGIRFGLAAVKNASVGAIEYIVEQREEGGPFANLGDFCRRLDLRRVGKRTLESLIRVGAMPEFARRTVLEAVLERMMNYSTRYHQDQEVGQMNLFGESAAPGEELLQNLPEIEEATPREMLRWEKELLGLYVTGRPVDNHRDKFRQIGAHIMRSIKEQAGEYNNRNVKVAGEVMGMRVISTRSGEQMCVLQLDDWHETAGSIEVVLFPRTWTAVKGQFVALGRELGEGEILVAIGKVDNTRGEPQIIAEKIVTDFDMLTADDNGSSHSNGSGSGTPDWAHDLPEGRDGRSQDGPPPRWSPEDEPPPWVLDEDAARDLTPDWALPPEEPLYDEETGELAQDEPSPPPPPVADAVAPATAGGTAAPTPALEPRFAPAVPAGAVPEWAVGAVDAEKLPIPVDELEEPPRRLTIRFPRTGDPNRDRLRLRRLHGLLVQYPGRDSFEIVLEGGPKEPVTLGFPNHTTGFCDDLLQDLASVVGVDNIEVRE